MSNLERLTNCISNIKICPIAHHRWIWMYQQINNPNTDTGSKIVGLRSIRLNPPTRNSHKQLTYSLSSSMSAIWILKGSRGSICLIMLTCFCTIRHIPLYLSPQKIELPTIVGSASTRSIDGFCHYNWHTQHYESNDPLNVRSWRRWRGLASS